ncbi:hypothetical protein CDL15_Pgr005537 [Punica granatum]|uniref:Uncharacterized protein n=1 Tax=Punica granatum TaxID=22663 RepID=A0A218WV84_PUNGR|nr:hypothetical protein CDL15_Pgr005537 [Punica granatum]
MLHASTRRIKPFCGSHYPFASHLTLCSPLSTIPATDDLLDFFDHLLHQCRSSALPPQLHSQIIVNGAHRSSFLAARLVAAYARFGSLAVARDVFDETSVECKSNLLLWNSIIRAYVTNGNCDEALRLYCQMRKFGVLGDGFTVPLVIRACAMKGGLSSNWGRILHCQSLQMGFHCNLHVMNELIGMYGKISQMDVARQVFDRMPVRSQVSWNTMVSGFSRNLDSDSAVEMVRLMKSEGMEPNIVTWTSLLSSHARCGRREETIGLFCEMRRRGIGCSPEVLAVVLSVCADGSVSINGRTVHGFALKSGCEDQLIVHNALISLYGKQGDIEGAKKIFSDIETKSIVSWNSLITSYVDCGLCDEAYELFAQLEELDDDCSMVKPNVISWSAVIDGFTSSGQGKEALELFRRMWLAKVEPNNITISSVLSACAGLAALNLGREIHGLVLRASMDGNVSSADAGLGEVYRVLEELTLQMGNSKLDTPFAG